MDEFVNADVIARNDRLPDIAAGRAAIERLNALAQAKRDIAFETTLASRVLLARIQVLRAAGYRCHLMFFWLPSADMAVPRVAQRVLTGGHAIPEDVVRRRYDRGMENFFNVYADAVDSWTFVDNTQPPGRQVASGRYRGKWQVRDNSLWSLLMRRYLKPQAQEPVLAEIEEDREFDAACDPDDIMRAINEAVTEAIDRHRARGEPIVVWKDGKVVWLKPGEY